MSAFILMLACPDSPGIVAHVSAELFGLAGNIVEAHQYNDSETGRFFSRIVFAVDQSEAALRIAFAPVARAFAMDWAIRALDSRHRALILVSRFNHCLVDLLCRWRTAELAMDVVGIVSNHPHDSFANFGDVPFHFLPVTQERRWPKRPG